MCSRSHVCVVVHAGDRLKQVVSISKAVVEMYTGDAEGGRLEHVVDGPDGRFGRVTQARCAVTVRGQPLAA